LENSLVQQNPKAKHGEPKVNARLSRADFLRLAGLTGGAAAVGGVLVKGLPTAASASTPSHIQDLDILNSLLLLEYLLASFYAEAGSKGAVGGDLGRFARVAADHEQAHVRFLRAQLGTKARERPEFDFGDATSSSSRFASGAVRLEELILSAYVGQGANLTRRSVLRVARIASVEARHAAWVRDIQKRPPAPMAADTGSSQRQIAAALEATGFVGGGAL
jgi:Ferritin-like domain